MTTPTTTQTADQLRHATEVARWIDREGRKPPQNPNIPDTIFLSKYNPIDPPPDLVPPHMALESYHGRTRYLPREMTNYSATRPAYGIRPLHDRFVEWLGTMRLPWLEDESDPRRGLHYAEKEGQSCFVCEDSINSGLLPKIFETNNEHLSGKLFNRGDTVLFCAPIYGLLPKNAYDKGIKLAAIPGNKENCYKPQADAIAAALETHPHARALMIVNPANPTGACLSEDEIDAIAQVVHEHNSGRAPQERLVLIVDETFKNLMWSKTGGAPFRQGPLDFTHMAAHPYLRDCTITIGSFSKDFAPGISFAFAFGHPDLIEAFSTGEGASYASQLYAERVFRHQRDVMWNIAGAVDHQRQQPGYYEDRVLADSLPHMLEPLDAMLAEPRDGNAQPDEALRDDLRHVSATLHGMQSRIARETHREQVLHDMLPVEQHLRASTMKYEASYWGMVNTLELYNSILAEHFHDPRGTEYIRVCNEPNAGFHVVLDCSGLKGFRVPGGIEGKENNTLETSFDLAKVLLRECGVSVFPGEMFYLDGGDMMLRASLNLGRQQVPPEAVTQQMRERMGLWPDEPLMRDRMLEALQRMFQFIQTLEKPVERQAVPDTLAHASRFRQIKNVPFDPYIE